MGRKAERRVAVAAPSLFLLVCAVGGYLFAFGKQEAPPPLDLDQRIQQARYEQWQAEERKRQLRREAMLKPDQLPHLTFVRQLVHTYGEDHELAAAWYLDDAAATFWQALDDEALARARSRLSDALLVREMFRVSRRDGSTMTNIYVIQNHRHSDRRSRILKQVGGERVPLSEVTEQYTGRRGSADDITRVPELFLVDLFSDEPVYELLDRRGRQRRAFTYGDCDEFEMAYVNLLAALDMEADVFLPRSIERKSHVRTRVEITAGDAPLWLEVDNTRHTARVSDVRPEAWSVPANHYNVAWINDHAHRPIQVEVGKEARRRIDDRVRRMLGF